MREAQTTKTLKQERKNESEEHTMKKYDIDYINETITLTAAFLRKASTLGTPEYKEMIELRRSLPGFQFVKAEAAKKTANKNKNLTYQNMREYIANSAESKKAAALLDEMKKVEGLSKIQSNPYKYVQAWFLKQFPECKPVHPDKNSEEKNATEKASA